ncbi:hypothetical protein BH23ACT9_BH23ACT9_10760 [soil metagenome]
MGDNTNESGTDGGQRPPPALLWAQAPTEGTAEGRSPSLPWDAEVDGRPVTPPPLPIDGFRTAGQGRAQPPILDGMGGAGPAGPHPLSEETVLRPRADRPATGWRAWLYRVTGGAVNLGPARSEQAWQGLVDRCRQPCPGGRRIAVISRKGGVGKTTTTLMIGHTLAAVRPDRVIAIDGNPDAGTLGHRVTRQTDATMIDALGRLGGIVGYPDARQLTSQAPSRLEVLASPEDPHASRALRGADYQSVMDVLDKHYNIMLCDTGTGIMDDANLGILDAVDQIVLVTGTALDSARAAGMTLDWLQTHDRAHLVRDAVVVVNAISDMGRVDIDQVARHFEERCRSVHRIPHDRHLEAGAVTDADLLGPSTQQAWLELAAAVVDGFALPSPRRDR